MKGERPKDPERIGKPFPLLKTFLVVLLPVILVSAIGLVLTLNNAISASAEKLFADQEIKLVRTMLLADGMFDGPAGLYQADLSALKKEVSETGIACLSAVDRRGELILRIDGHASCTPVEPDAFEDVTLRGGPIMAEDIVLPGTWTSLGSITRPGSIEPVLAAATRRSLPFETAISRSTGFWTLVFAGVFLLAVAATAFVIVMAQKTIDGQAAYVRGVHLRLRRFLSVAAVRNAIDDEAAPTRFEAVVMFLDLRDFSSFAESGSPHEVATLIDDFVTFVAGAVADQGDEIDKIIGDGIMAVFRGDDAEQRAANAAIASIKACRDLIRRPGVGLFKGEVIATALGTGNRADFTILGRTVNLASRLCALSGEGEITVPERFFVRVSDELFEVSRDVVKPRHHREAMTVVRFELARCGAGPLEALAK